MKHNPFFDGKSIFHAHSPDLDVMKTGSHVSPKAFVVFNTIPRDKL